MLPANAWASAKKLQILNSWDLGFKMTGLRQNM
jgi:hypothetical protein